MHVEFSWTEDQYRQLVAACRDNPMTPFIKEHLPKNGPILEAGCGLGQFVKYFSDFSYNIYGIEVNQKAVEIVNRLDPHLKITQGNIESLPYPNNYFEGLMCFGVVEHIIEGPDKALSELYRVLQPGAKALISVPVFNTLRKFKHYTGLAFVDYYFRKAYHTITRKEMDWLYADTLMVHNPPYHRWPAAGGFFEYRFSREEISTKLRETNFEILEEIPLEGLGGLYFELSGKLVNLSKPSTFISWLDTHLSVFPFFHHHTYLAIVKKPQ